MEYNTILTIINHLDKTHDHTCIDRDGERSGFPSLVSHSLLNVLDCVEYSRGMPTITSGSEESMSEAASILFDYILLEPAQYSARTGRLD